MCISAYTSWTALERQQEENHKTGLPLLEGAAHDQVRGQITEIYEIHRQGSPGERTAPQAERAAQGSRH